MWGGCGRDGIGGGGGGGEQASDVGTVGRIPDLGWAGPPDPEDGIYLLKFPFLESCYGSVGWSTAFCLSGPGFNSCKL